MLLPAVDENDAAYKWHHLVRKEIRINTLATAVIAAVLTWLIFRGRNPIEVFEAPPHGIFGLFPGSFNFTLLVALVLTLVTRSRVRRGEVPRANLRRAPRLVALLPAHIVIRALMLALCALLLWAVPVAASLWGLIHVGLMAPQWTMAGMLGLFVVHFSLLSWWVTPLVVWRALCD